MNFIGKILVVLIVIMSIIFMTLAAAVYSTHRNWEQLASQRAQERDDARAELQATTNEYNRREAELEAQREAALQRLRQLESERESLASNNTTLQREVDELRTQWAEASAAVNATQQSSTLVAQRNNELRESIRAAREATDDAFVKMLNATEEAQQLQGELEIATERRQELTEEVARMTSVMREEGIDPATQLDEVTPRVDGYVQRVARSEGQLLIQVTIGSDDGLKRGDTVEIFRGTRYLGRAEILRTEPNRAIGRVDPRFQEGRIQEQDRVATRLTLG